MSDEKLNDWLEIWSIMEGMIRKFDHIARTCDKNAIFASKFHRRQVPPRRPGEALFFAADNINTREPRDVFGKHSSILLTFLDLKSYQAPTCSS